MSEKLLNLKSKEGEKKKKNGEKMKQNIQEVWDSYKKFNTNVMGIPEEERKRRKFEAIMTNFPKLSDSKPQIEEAQNTMQDKY